MMTLRMVMNFDRPTLVAGAKSREGIPFLDRARRLLGDKVVFVTEDGSFGEKGLASEVAIRIMDEFEIVYTCGPEPMMATALAVEEKLSSAERIIVCVERHTVCGVGLCGKCAMDGYRTCVDGPCFSLASLSKDTAFGRYRRGPSGLRELC